MRPHCRNCAPGRLAKEKPPAVTTFRYQRSATAAKVAVTAAQVMRLCKGCLSVSQENRLADWIKAQDALGLAPTYAQVRALAARLLREQGDHTPLGKDWHIRFLQRQRSIKSLGASKVDEKYLDLSGEVLRGQAMSTFIQESKGSA